MSTATVNGIDLAYIEQGQGEPVLFVHGGAGDYRAWDQQMNAFGAGYRAIALSCRGYWPNPKLRPDKPVTLDTFADDLAQFVQALDAGPVHLVGHSSPGGFGSLRLASQHPELLRTLVLLEPRLPAARRQHTAPACPGDQAADPAPSRRHRLHQVRRQGNRPGDQSVRARRRCGSDAGLHGRQHQRRGGGRHPRGDVPAVRRQCRPLKAQIKAGFPPFAACDARAIRVPTLLVSGAESPAHIQAVTDRLAKLVPDADRLTIAGATHNMFNSHPAEFNAGVLRFIRSHSLPT